MGRPRKFRLGDIAYVKPHGLHRYVVIVDYKTTRTFREYRVVPLDAKLRRAGRAYWIRSARLAPTGMKSKGSVKTYLVNEQLTSPPGEFERGCDCQCCCHEAIPLSEFDSRGEWSS